MPTLYPKCTPSELMGFLLLLNNHRGSQEIARLADEESLAMDKLLPAVEYAEGLGLVSISDGRASFTDAGRLVMAANIRVRKDLLRELLKRTILFRAILRSLEQSVDGTVAEDELQQIVAFTTAPPEAVQDIINWGRYAGIFRYDANQHAILPMGPSRRGKTPTPVAIPMPPSAPPAPPKTVAPRPKAAAPKPASPPAAGRPSPGKAAPARPSPSATPPTPAKAEPPTKPAEPASKRAPPSA